MDKYHEEIICVVIQTQPKEEAIRTYSYSKAGYFNPLWTPQLVRLTDQIRSHYAQYSDYVQYAVTLQTKLVTRRDNFRKEQLLIHLQGDFWNFNKRLNYHFFKKSCHRKPHLYSLLMLPVIEGSAFCPDEKRTLHYHVGLGNVPKEVDETELCKVIRQHWIKTKFGADDIDIQPADPGWSGYITKEVEKGNVECIDWRNASIPHEALHI